MAQKEAFVAYPAKPHALADAIREAVSRANKSQPRLHYQIWEENDIAGRPLVAPILSGIGNAELLVADVTVLNFNVTYEIGYSIGRRKRVFLVRNRAVASDDQKAAKVGIFDTFGFELYSNSLELERLLSQDIDLTPLAVGSALDREAPLYLLETPLRSQAMTRIVARVKRARLKYRSFTPSEESRLPAIDAINHVATSYGVLVPLLSPQMADAEIHNIRAAFVAGLAHGMGKATLILQDGSGPVPLDVRDFAKTYHYPDDINEHVQALALDVYEAFQEAGDLKVPGSNWLAQITIGDPMAENEFQTLGNYYLRTDEFNRAVRGEVNLVVGRKGTGKTALFSQIRNEIRRNKQNIVADLKPEGYQLIKLKENVLDFLTEGAKAHLITAFWEYLLYLEVAYKVLEKDARRYIRDHTLYEDYRRLADIYHENPNVSEGDFSERLLTLSNNVAQAYRGKYGDEREVRLTADEITELIHLEFLRSLRFVLARYLEHKGAVWILFDNLDKGWLPRGLATGDILILRCLIDASRKIQREMQKAGLPFHSVVFIRNDVYQLLMEETPDFGKEMRASLEWSDPDLLREMLRRRLVQNDPLPKDAELQRIWGRICVTHYRGEETSQYLIDRCLMRPRNFLKIFSRCRGFAVNLGHDKIEVEDIEKGLKSYSTDLIIEADQELSEIEPKASRLIYQFRGEQAEYSLDELEFFFELYDLPEEDRQGVIDYLLYYGFFGVRQRGEEATFIFDVGYDMRMLKAVIDKGGEAISYVLNPAFWPALNIGANEGA